MRGEKVSRLRPLLPLLLPLPSFSISPFLSVALDLIFSSTSVLGR